jgi:hypothetical protein
MKQDIKVNSRYNNDSSDDEVNQLDPSALATHRGYIKTEENEQTLDSKAMA